MKKLLTISAILFLMSVVKVKAGVTTISYQMGDSAAFHLTAEIGRAHV